MPRKENKLRPYRVDYFDLNEINATEQVLVQSTTVRAVTAFEAADFARTENGVWNEGRYVIRSYRYYKPLKFTPVYKDLEDLFTAKWVKKVKASIEETRKLFESRRIDKQFAAMATDTDYRKLMQELNPAFDFGLKTAPVPCGTAEIASRNNYADPDLHHIDLDEVAPIVSPAPAADCHCSFAFPVSSSAMELHMIAAHGQPDTGQVATAVEEAMSVIAPEHGDVIASAVATVPAVPQMLDYSGNYTPEFVTYTLEHHPKDCGCQICWNNRPNPEVTAVPTGQVLVSTGSFNPHWEKPLPTWAKVGLFGLVVALSVVAILVVGR